MRDFHFVAKGQFSEFLTGVQKTRKRGEYTSLVPNLQSQILYPVEYIYFISLGFQRVKAILQVGLYQSFPKEFKKIYLSIIKSVKVGVKVEHQLLLPNFFCTRVGSCITRVVSCFTRAVSCCTLVVSCYFVFYSCWLVLCHVVLVLPHVVLVLCRVALCCYLCSFLD